MKNKAVISLFVFMLLSMFICSKEVHAVPVESYEIFAENIDNGFYIMENEEVFTGQDGDSVDVCIGLRSGNKCYGISIIVDPEAAILFSSFELNGIDILGDLVAHAILPENVIFTQYFSDFLGGATLYGTKAFSGTALDENGNPILTADVGFSVFETDNGEHFFTPIAFIPTFPENVAFFSMELEPVVSDSFEGTFTGVGRRLITIPPDPIPEPSTLSLYAVGIILIGGIRRVFRGKGVNLS